MVDVEALADWVYRRTESSQIVPPGPAHLLEALIGRHRIQFDDGGAVRIDRRGGELRATIPRALPPTDLSLALGMAVAQVAAILTGQETIPDGELLWVVAAILMPTPALAVAVGSLGFDAHGLAGAFVVPADVAALRIRRSGWLAQSGEFGPFSTRGVG